MIIRLSNGMGKASDEPVPDASTIGQVMSLKKLSGQTAIAVLNGAVAHPDTPLKEGDELELIGVIYGG